MYSMAGANMPSGVNAPAEAGGFGCDGIGFCSVLLSASLLAVLPEEARYPPLRQFSCLNISNRTLGSGSVPQFVSDREYTPYEDGAEECGV